jgi:hypothetical protein
MLFVKKRAAIDGGLRGLFTANLADAQWTPIETGATAQGCPDLEGCFPGGVQVWIEGKATSAWAVRIDREQVGWLMRRRRLGGRAFISVRRAEDELWLLDGDQAALLKAEGLKPTTPVLPVQYRGPKNWDWAAIQLALTR